MPKFPLFVIDCNPEYCTELMEELRLMFHLRVFFCSNLKFEMLLQKAPFLSGDVKTQ